MNQAVILSEAKDHLESMGRREMILRFAQDDMPFRAFHFSGGSLEACPHTARAAFQHDGMTIAAV